MDRIKKNFIYNIIYHVVSLIIPLIVTPYITRSISQELLGRNTYICTQVTYFCLFGTLGMNYLGTREIAKHAQDGMEKIRARFYSLYHLQVASYLMILILYIGYLFVFPSYMPIKLLYFLMIFSCMTDINWLFMGMEQFQFISLRNCLIRIICTGLVFLLVKNDRDLNIYIVCLYLPQLILNAIMWIYVFRKVGKDSFSYRIQKGDIRRNVVLAIPGIAISVYTILDKLVIGLFQPVESVALYDQGQSIVRIVLSAVSAFGTVAMPRISGMIKGNNKEETISVIKKCSEFTWLISSALMFGLIGVASTFISWYLPENYSYVTNVIIYTSPLVMISSAENVMGVQILIPHGGEKFYSISLVAAAVVNFCLDIIFIPRFGVAAACICSVVAEGTALFIQCFFVRKYVRLGEILRLSVFYLVASAVMYFMLRTLEQVISLSPQAETMVLVAVGGTFYLFACWIRKLMKGQCDK